MNLRRRLKRYDKLLDYRKCLDGRVIIYRQSPFNAQKQHDILTIKNQKLGRWVIDKIIQMDTQKFDIVGDVMRNNMNIQKFRKDNRQTRDLVDFIHKGEQFIS